jgi:hypothetical protein
LVHPGVDLVVLEAVMAARQRFSFFANGQEMWDTVKGSLLVVVQGSIFISQTSENRGACSFFPLQKVDSVLVLPPPCF